MKICKEIALIRLTQTDQWSHEKSLPQEYMELRGGTTARGASADPPDKN